MKLRELRNRKQLTQSELEEISGVDQGTISSYELGKIKNPSFENVLKLARALDVAPDELFREVAS